MSNEVFITAIEPNANQLCEFCSTHTHQKTPATYVVDDILSCKDHIAETIDDIFRQRHHYEH